MKILKYVGNINSNNINIEIIAVLYCICIMSSTFIRWMNYFNVVASAIMVIYIFKTKRIGKSLICLLWASYIVVYPILDAAIRGETGLSLFTALSYITPLLLLLLTDVNIDNFVKILILFIKAFSWFQAFGIFLSLIWNRAYTIIAWRALGYWSYGVTGFATDATVTAYILCFGIGIYLIELRALDKKQTKAGFIKLMYVFTLLVALILTGKRSFFVAVICSSIIIFLANSMHSKKIFSWTFWSSLIMVLVSYFLCIGAYYLGMNNALGRVGQTFMGLLAGEDVTSMRSTWAAYMNEWSQGHRFFGIGWESFKNRIAYTPYAGKVPNGHCVYRQILCEEGYFGEMVFLIIMAVTIILAIYNVIKLSSSNDKVVVNVAMFSAFAVILFAIYCYSGNAMYDATIYLYFFAVIQLISLVSRERKRIYHNKALSF